MMFFIKDYKVKLSEASETKTPYSILHPCWQRKSLPRELIGSRCHIFVNSTYSQWFSTTICVNFPDATILKKVSKRERKYMLCICQDFRNCASDLFSTVQPQPLCLSSVNSEQIISFCADLKIFLFIVFCDLLDSLCLLIVLIWAKMSFSKDHLAFLFFPLNLLLHWPIANRDDARHHDSESNFSPRHKL